MRRLWAYDLPRTRKHTMTEHPRDSFMRRLMSNLDGEKDRQVTDMLTALKQIEYASRKDSLTETERLQSMRTVVCAALSRHHVGSPRRQT